MDNQAKELLIDKIKKTDVNVKLKISIVLLLVLTIISFIIFINIKNTERIENLSDDFTINDITITLSKDDNINEFIKNYFEARINMRYDIVFDSYGMSFKNDIKDTVEQNIISNIKYENSYIKKYDNFVIYEMNGITKNEKVLLVMYDIELAFTNQTIPSMIMCFITTSPKIVFKDKLTLGESKYLNQISKTDFVKKLYNEVKDSVEKILKADENARLVYNSLRQYSMNQNNNLEQDDYSIQTFDLDPIEDNDIILDIISQYKKLKQKEN